MHLFGDLADCLHVVSCSAQAGCNAKHLNDHIQFCENEAGQCSMQDQQLVNKCVELLVMHDGAAAA
jgi:hypothetical protein